jgi:hypothetical protein
VVDIDAWIRQPTTIHGIGVVAAGIGYALTHLATGNPTYDTVIAVAAYALVHLGIDDHSAVQQAVTATTLDLLNGAAPAKVLSDAAPLTPSA